MERFKQRPSMGTIFGLAALVVALAGTAIAAPLAIKSAFSKAEKKQVKKIATKQINTLAPGLFVAHAGSANAATNAEKPARRTRPTRSEACRSSRSDVGA